MNNDELEKIRTLVNDSIISNNVEFIVQLIYQLKKDYVELAKLSTLGYYKEDWTHLQVINCVTYET